MSLRFKLLCLAGLLLLVGCGPTSLSEEPSSEAASLAAKAPVGANVGPVTVSLNAGWNAVGFQAASLTSVNAGSAVAGMAYYDGGYHIGSLTMAEANAGEGTRRGFWIYATAATTFTYSGTEAAGVALNLKSGWNLVAFPTTTNIAGAALICRRGGQPVPLTSYLLAQFYEIGAGSNTPVDVTAGGTCKPGKAYWVYALDTVTLGYGSAPASPTPTPAASPSPTATPSPSASPSSGFFTLTTTTIVRPSPESFDNHEGGYNVTYQPGQIDSHVYHKIGGGGVTVMGWFKARLNWSAPPSTIHPGEVWPLTCTATLLDFKSPLNWSAGVDGNVDGQYVFVNAAGNHVDTLVWQNSALAGNPVGYTVTHNTYAKAPGGGRDFDLQIFSTGIQNYQTWYHYKWNP